MTTMRSVSLRLFVAAAILLAQCFAFTLRCPAVTTSNARIAASSPLFRSTQVTKRVPLFMSTDEPKGEEAAAVEDVDEDDEDGAEEPRSLLRTIILTVPLFCKFCVVLAIKFVTDLIVFPLLFLYRLAGLTKRRILKMFGSGGKIDKVNGET